MFNYKIMFYKEAVSSFAKLNTAKSRAKTLDLLFEVYEDFRTITKTCINVRLTIPLYLQAKRRLFFDYYLPTLSDKAQKIINNNPDIFNKLLDKTPYSENPIDGIIIENFAKLIKNEHKDIKVQLLHALLTAYHPDTGINHCLKMKTELVWMAVDIMSLNKEETKEIENACLVHDIGKLLTSIKYFLDNPKSQREMGSDLFEKFEKERKSHPLNGYYLLSIFDLDDFTDFDKLRIHALKHHYSFQKGKSYPFYPINVKKFPIKTQIIYVLDVFNALKEPRSYKETLPFNKIDEILDEIIEHLTGAVSPELIPLVNYLKMELISNSIYR